MRRLVIDLRSRLDTAGLATFNTERIGGQRARSSAPYGISPARNVVPRVPRRLNVTLDTAALYVMRGAWPNNATARSAAR
jgi:hypothetical protein